MSSGELALASRIRAELIELERLVERTERLFNKAQTRDEDYLDGVALNLHSFYAGIEHIFEDIAREIDQSLPSGPDWHRSLLLQMSAELLNVRPAVLSRNTRYCLDEYRGFRHVVRNVYTFNLRPSRLQDLVADLRSCHLNLSQDLTAFCKFLDELDLDD